MQLTQSYSGSFIYFKLSPSPRYCDCFANGEFCNNCNCNNCFNNLEHETERLKAIKVCLRFVSCLTGLSCLLSVGWIKVKCVFHRRVWTGTQRPSNLKLAKAKRANRIVDTAKAAIVNDQAA